MQTVHLSCIKISTISKKIEPSVHLSPFTKEYQQVRPKWFLRLCCIRSKLCTYLAPKLTMSPNEPKQDSIWHTSSRSSIGCIQIDFEAYGMFHANHAPTLHKDQHYLQTNRTKLPLEPLHQEYQIVHPKWFLRLWCIRHKLCTYVALKLTMSANGPKQDSIWHTSSRSSIGCVQIDFQAYGMFFANHAPILHQD